MASFFSAMGDFFNELLGKEDTGVTPLHAAAMDGNQAEAERLLAEGADVNARTKLEFGGMTPLVKAAIKGHETIVDFLLNNGADIEAGDGRGMTPLMYAISNRQNGIITLLIKRGADVNAIANEFNPLMHAGAAGEEEIVEALLQHGARPVTPPSPSQDTLLHYPKAVPIFLKRSLCLGDVNKPNAHGDTPLLKAIDKANVPAVNALLRHGADISFSGAAGDPPFNVASFKCGVAINSAWDTASDLLACVEALLKAGADPNSRDHSGSTPMHSAAMQGAFPLMEMLLANGADINAKEAEGNTPLNFAGILAESATESDAVLQKKISEWLKQRGAC